MKKLILIFALAIATLPAMAPACPMCKDSIGSNEAAEATSVPGGFNASIYLMLGTFTAALGICGGVIAKACRTPTNVNPRHSERYAAKNLAEASVQDSSRSTAQNDV